MAAIQVEKETPWHAAYPAPVITAGGLTREQLLKWMGEGKVAGKDYVLVDLRRVDYEGGTIRGSINLPAQSLYDTIPSLYTLFSTAKVTRVIWYCGSSRGRGNRAAGWFADYIKSQNDSAMESLVLEGGIRGWATAGEEYVKEMTGYNGEVWK
ncbi:Rhodanese-like domain-containing protein [Tricladium varicosporioides]|nr:Rhodanese-like domain-containing protein [Hymenoscyphus varicosporioides]